MNSSPSSLLTVIEPVKGSVRENLVNIFKYRGLLYYLCKRFIKGFYRGTILGIGWVFLRLLVPILLA